jgi:two-component system, LytTR family, response regulator
MIRAIIVDDEAYARKNLQLLLHKYCENVVEVIAESDNVADAYTLINKLKPSVVFLDIEMGEQTGFDLLAKFPQPEFTCIFITAYDKYAVKAIKFCALDYILKPIDYKELQLAVAKAKNALKEPEIANMQNLITVLKKPNNKTNKLAIPTATGFKLMPVQNIMYLEAEKECTFIYCNNDQKLCSTIALGEYEEILSDYTFFRIHHSFIINKEFITSYVKGEGGEVILPTGKNLPVSRRKKMEFLDWLN